MRILSGSFLHAGHNTDMLTLPKHLCRGTRPRALGFKVEKYPGLARTSSPILRPVRKSRLYTIVRADLGGALESILTYGALGVSVAAAMFAILPDPEPTIQPEGKRDDTDNFRWGLMGFISAFPLFNWLVRIDESAI